MYEIFIVKIGLEIGWNDPHQTSDLLNLTATKSEPILVHSDTDPLIEHKVLDAKLKMGDNVAGSLEFTLPPSNAAYNEINKCLTTEVIVYREAYDQEYGVRSVPIWYGRLLTIDEDFWKQKKCVFEGELAYFLDSIQLPSYYSQSNTTTGINASQFFENWLRNVIDWHNSVVEPYKRFTLGSCPTGPDIDTYGTGKNKIEIKTNYENTLDTLRNNILDAGLNVHVYIRHVGDTRYIDFLYGYKPVQASQTINFGENLLDYASNINGNEYCTVIYPRGVKVERNLKDKDAEYNLTGDQTIMENETYYERKVHAEFDETSGKAKTKKVVYDRVNTDSIYEDNEQRVLINPHEKNWYTRTDYYKTSDRIVVNGKTYYQRHCDTVGRSPGYGQFGEAVCYGIVDKPAGSPKKNKYLENYSGNFQFSQDTEVDEDKTYYIVAVEKVVWYEQVTPRRNQNPHDLGWYEQYHKSDEEEYFNMVGAKTGLYDNNNIYIDGQGGRAYSLPGVQKYGYIYNIVDFDCKSPEQLADNARKYLNQIDFDEMTVEISALDLHYLDTQIQTLEVLDQVICKSEPHGFNSDTYTLVSNPTGNPKHHGWYEKSSSVVIGTGYDNNYIYYVPTEDTLVVPNKQYYQYNAKAFPVTEVEIDLINPENTKYTLCGKGNKSISKTTGSDSKNFTKFMNGTQIVSKSEILEAARAEADDTIQKSMDGSYAGFVYVPLALKGGGSTGSVDVDPDNPNLGKKATGLRIANAATDEQATSRWLFYSGGLAHYNKLDNGSWDTPNVAITMDGKIVADFITAGAIRLTGSIDRTSSTKDPASSTFLMVYDVRGNEIGSWSSAGIRIAKGSITITDGSDVSYFSVSEKGYLTARGATISGNVTIESGSISIVSGDTTYFKVTKDGKMSATSGTFSGNIKGSKITGSTLHTREAGEKGKHVDINSDSISIYNDNNNSSGYLRLYRGAKVSGHDYYPYEFGIASDNCHARWGSSGQHYAEVESRYIILAAQYYKEHYAST